jgi:hypothetical protein
MRGGASLPRMMAAPKRLAHTDAPADRRSAGGCMAVEGQSRCDGSFSETASLQLVGRFCAFFSGPEIPFPGNGDRQRQRLGSNAGYAEGSPSIWC